MKSGSTIQYTQHYSGGIEYRQGATGAPVIEAIYHPEGRVFYTSATASRYEYSIRDHLGNTRLTFSDLNNNNKVDITTTTTNEVLQENNYYPFGLGTNGVWMNSATSLDNLYQYNGKELNADWGLNMIDYGARMYMADLGRWSGVDELGELYLESAPYAYVLNSPVKFIDLDGRYLLDSDGNKVSMRRNRKNKEIEFYSKEGKEISEGTLEVLKILSSTKDGRALLRLMNHSSRGFQLNLSEEITFSIDNNGLDLTRQCLKNNLTCENGHLVGYFGHETL